MRVAPYLIRRVRESMEKVTVTKGEILAGFEAAGVASAAKCGPLLKLKIAEFKHSVRHLGIPVQDAIEALKIEHAKKNAAGDPVPLKVQGTEIPGAYEYPDGGIAFRKAEREMLDAKAEITVPLFTRDELEKLGEFAGDIEGLVPFIKKAT